MENHNPSSQIPKKKRKLVELLECKDYIVPLNPDVIVKKTIYRSSARITNQQRDQVKRVLHKQGYQGRISSIRYTRVNYKYSFKVSVKYRGSVGKFLVNTKNETVEFKGMVWEFRRLNSQSEFTDFLGIFHLDHSSTVKFHKGQIMDRCFIRE